MRSCMRRRSSARLPSTHQGQPKKLLATGTSSAKVMPEVNAQSFLLPLLKDITICLRVKPLCGDDASLSSKIRELMSNSVGLPWWHLLPKVLLVTQKGYLQCPVLLYCRGTCLSPLSNEEFWPSHPFLHLRWFQKRVWVSLPGDCISSCVLVVVKQWLLC